MKPVVMLFGALVCSNGLSAQGLINFMGADPVPEMEGIGKLNQQPISVKPPIGNPALQDPLP